MASEPLNPPAPARSGSWLRENRGRILRFAGVGMSGVVVNLVIFAVVFHLILVGLAAEDLRFVLANAAGFLVSVFTNFLLNDNWTWGDRAKGGFKNWWQRLAKYYVTASSAGIVQIVTAWLSLTLVWSLLQPQIAGFDLAPLLGVLTGIGCGMAINFTASHLWAFRDAPEISPH